MKNSTSEKKPKQAPSWSLELTTEVKDSAAALVATFTELGEATRPFKDCCSVTLHFATPEDRQWAGESLGLLEGVDADCQDADLSQRKKLEDRCVMLEKFLEGMILRGHSEIPSREGGRRARERKFLQDFQALKARAEKLHPPHCLQATQPGLELPDFHQAQRQRQRYLIDLQRLELKRNDLARRLNHKLLTGPDDVLSCSAALPGGGSDDSLPGCYLTTLASVVLGGPLHRLCQEIARSNTGLQCLELNHRWKDLCDLYRRLHAGSNCLRFKFCVPANYAGPLEFQLQKMFERCCANLCRWLRIIDLPISPEAAPPVVPESKVEGAANGARSIIVGAEPQSTKKLTVHVSGMPQGPQVKINGKDFPNTRAAVRALLALFVLRCNDVDKLVTNADFAALLYKNTHRPSKCVDNHVKRVREIFPDLVHKPGGRDSHQPVDNQAKYTDFTWPNVGFESTFNPSDRQEVKRWLETKRAGKAASS